MARRDIASKLKYFACQAGQGMTEYIIIVAVIAIASIAVYTFYGDDLRYQTSAATEALAGMDGSAETSHAQNHALAAKMDADVGKGMDNFSNTSH